MPYCGIMVEQYSGDLGQYGESTNVILQPPANSHNQCDSNGKDVEHWKNFNEMDSLRSKMLKISDLGNVDVQNKRKGSLQFTLVDCELSLLPHVDGRNKRKCSFQFSKIELETNSPNVNGQNKRRANIPDSYFDFESKVQNQRKGSVQWTVSDFELSLLSDVHDQNKRKCSFQFSTMEFETNSSNYNDQNKQRVSIHDSDSNYEIQRVCESNDQKQRKGSVQWTVSDFELSLLSDVNGQNKRKYSFQFSTIEFENNYPNYTDQNKQRVSIHDSDSKYEIQRLCESNDQKQRKGSIQSTVSEFELSLLSDVDDQNKRKCSFQFSTMEFETNSPNYNDQNKQRVSIHDSDSNYEIQRLCESNDQKQRKGSIQWTVSDFELSLLSDVGGQNKRRVSSFRLDFNLDELWNEDVVFTKDLVGAQQLVEMTRSLKPEVKTVVTDGKIWEYVRNLLLDRSYCPDWVEWTDYNLKRFRFKKTKEVAKLWAERKGKKEMMWENFSRALRYYYDKGILQKVEGTQLRYEFGPNAYGLETDDPNFVKANIFKSKP